MNDRLISMALIASVAFFALMLSRVIKGFSSVGRGQANALVCVCTLLLLGVNQILPDDKYFSLQVVATAVLLVSIYPLWRYLLLQEKNIPFVPLLSLIYGIYFAIPSFFAFSPFISFEGVQNESRVRATYEVLYGLLCMLLVFYKVPRNVWDFWTPQLRSVGWSPQLATKIAIGFGALGIIANGILTLLVVDNIVRAPLVFVSQFSLLSIAILLYLQLKGQLAPHLRLVLWFLILPAQLLVDVSSGFIYPLVRDSLAILMVYLMVKKRIPWHIVIPAVSLVTVLLLGKGEFRQSVWSSGISNPLDSVSVYVEVIQDIVLSSDDKKLNKSIGDVVSRLDNGTLLAHVVQQTPSKIPYWNGESYMGVLWRFIPRVIWTNKPIEELGQTFGHRYEILSENDTTTSWNMPQIVEMYANFGTLGVIAGMAVLGALYRILRNILEYNPSDEWSKLSAIVIYTSLLQVDGNFSLVFGNVIYWVVLLNLMGRVIFSSQKRRMGNTVPNVSYSR